MGFFKKFLGTAAVAGAVVGSAMYVKKRKVERDLCTENDFEDFDDVKVFGLNKDDEKISISINKRKAKSIADKAADKVIDATDCAKATITEKIGEEKMEVIKEKADEAKEKISEVANTVVDKAALAKDAVVEKIGEDNIQAAKDKVVEVATNAKDKVVETVEKIKNDAETEDDVIMEDDFLEEEVSDL